MIFLRYYIPARRINVAKLGLFIRKDWMDKLNMAEPTTTEEWVAYLRAAKEAKLGGEQTVPYAMKLYENSPLFSTSVIVDSFLDFSKITKEDWYSLYHEQMPGAKEAYRLLNTLYNEGLISENFAIDNGDIRDRDLNQGYAGFYIEGPTQVWPDYSDEMKKNVGEDAEWIPVNPFVNPDGYTLHENYAANGICIFIPSWVNKETAVAAMKYMDWMAQPENMFYLQNGIEGVHYDHLNEDGLPVGRVTNDNLPDDQKWLSAVDLVFLSNGSSFGNDELNNKYLFIAYLYMSAAASAVNKCIDLRFIHGNRRPLHKRRCYAQFRKRPLHTAGSLACHIKIISINQKIQSHSPIVILFYACRNVVFLRKKSPCMKLRCMHRDSLGLLK